MSPDKPGQAAQDKPDDVAQLAGEAAEPKQAAATAAHAAEGEGKAAKGESKAKAGKAKAASAPTKAKAAKRAPAKKASPGEDAEAAQPARVQPKAPAAKRRRAAKPAAAEEAEPRSGKQASASQRRRVVRAHARYVRTSARKARIVCGHLRGKSVQEARAILDFTPREAARDWKKLLESAVANAETNHELIEDDLIVREAYADEGPTIKRFRPRAMGRATPIRKRTSHLTIALIPRPQDANSKRKG